MDNPREECKALTETKRERDWEDLMEFKRWFATLGMTLEEAYDMSMDELEEFHQSQTAGPTMPPKKTDSGSVAIICEIEDETLPALCDIGFQCKCHAIISGKKVESQRTNYRNRERAGAS
jgi:hypothetical protein